MRKTLTVLGIILIVVTIGSVGGYKYYKYTTSPERLILGAWKSSVTSYDFKEDGVVKIGTSLSLDGKYTINEEKNTISITYTAFDLSYTNEYTYSFGSENKTLTLTDTNLQKFSQVYERVTENVTEV